MRAALLILVLAYSVAAAGQRVSQDSPAAQFQKLPWQLGPGTATIAGKASLKLDSNDAFLAEQGTRQLLVIMGNPPRDGHYAIVPKTDNEDWVGIFAFDPSGYVSDEDKIDADALLAAMMQNDGETNQERKKLGLQELHLIGWHVPPHYDQQTKRLEWGTRLRAEDGSIVVNYTARLLSRSGVMRAVLITEPATLDADRKSFARRLERFQFNPGETYSEFRQGDKVAGYGLAALVAGGAAAVATKKGLWAVIGGFLAAFWKIIAGAAVALLAGLAKVFGSKKS